MTENKLKEIGEKLRRRRKELGLTLQDIADHVGVSKNYISEIERGRGKTPSEDIISKMAIIYRYDELDLFDGFDKLPKGLIEGLDRNNKLKRTLFEIEKSRYLSESEKDELAKEIQRLYETVLKKRSDR